MPKDIKVFKDTIYNQLQAAQMELSRLQTSRDERHKKLIEIEDQYAKEIGNINAAIKSLELHANKLTTHFTLLSEVTFGDSKKHEIMIVDIKKDLDRLHSLIQDQQKYVIDLNKQAIEILSFEANTKQQSNKKSSTFAQSTTLFPLGAQKIETKKHSFESKDLKPSSS